MPGPRYTDWTHTRVVGGSREDAAPYLAEARKVLGWVVQDAGNLGLQTHKLQRRLPDGAVLTGELRGGIPRMTIQPPPRQPAETPRHSLDDFVVWARDDTLPNGIDVVHPEQILRPAWKTYFYDSQVDGYDTFDESKGTYVGVFPTGIRHAGNVDWVGRDEARLSWYGPSTRYWLEPYVQPPAQYGKFVFQLGQVVLDMDDYLANIVNDTAFTELWVLGAARRGLWLYVVHTLVYQFATTPTNYPRKQGVITDVVQPAAVSDVVLSRFRLVGPGPFLTVLNDSREELWRQTRTFPTQPWFFNASCTQAVCHALPASAVVTPTAYLIFPLSTSHKRLLLDIPKDDADPVVLTETDVSLTTVAGQRAAIAADFVGDTLVELEARLDLAAEFLNDPAPSYKTASLVLGSSENAPSWLLYEPIYRQMEGQETGFVSRLLVHADLRTGVLVFLRNSDWSSALHPEPATPTLEVWRRGVQVHEAVLTLNPATGGDAYHLMGLDPAAGPAIDSVVPYAVQHPAISPLLLVFGIFAQVYRFEAGYHYFFPVFRPAHIGFKFLVRPASELFGLYKPGKRFGGDPEALEPALLIPDSSDASPENAQQDFDLNRSVCGCASNDDVVLLSLSLPHDTATFEPPYSAHFVTSTTLPVLTGVIGVNARYHPIWRLGKPPTGVSA